MRRPDLADLVEEEGASLGGLDLARLVAHRPGERPADVAEQLARQQLIGEGGAVHGDERLLRPRREAVQGAREHALAGAVLAPEQQRGVGGGGAAQDGERRLHRGGAGLQERVGHPAGQPVLERLHPRPELARRSLSRSTTARICAGLKGFGR